MPGTGLTYTGQPDGGALTIQTLQEIIAAATAPLGPATGQTALTALSGGGQTGATQLQTGLNQIATVAAGNDSCILPASIPGNIVVVSNKAAANASNIYAQGTDTINAIAASSPFSLAANKVAIFFCFVAGTWNSILTA